VSVSADGKEISKAFTLWLSLVILDTGNDLNSCHEREREREREREVEREIAFIVSLILVILETGNDLESCKGLVLVLGLEF
jgi:hypothetical protein